MANLGTYATILDLFEAAERISSLETSLSQAVGTIRELQDFVSQSKVKPETSKNAEKDIKDLKSSVDELKESSTRGEVVGNAVKALTLSVGKMTGEDGSVAKATQRISNLERSQAEMKGKGDPGQDITDRLDKIEGMMEELRAMKAESRSEEVIRPIQTGIAGPYVRAQSEFEVDQYMGGGGEMDGPESPGLGDVPEEDEDKVEVEDEQAFGSTSDIMPNGDDIAGTLDVEEEEAGDVREEEDPSMEEDDTLAIAEENKEDKVKGEKEDIGTMEEDDAEVKAIQSSEAIVESTGLERLANHVEISPTSAVVKSKMLAVYGHLDDPELVAKLPISYHPHFHFYRCNMCKYSVKDILHHFTTNASHAMAYRNSLRLFPSILQQFPEEDPYSLLPEITRENSSSI